MESQVFSSLVIVAFGLMVVVTGGIGYLTVMEWRDRRQREAIERAEQPRRSSRRASKAR